MSAELDAAKKRLEQAKARYQKAAVKERERERKADARRKIIIGGSILSLIASQSPEKREITLKTVLRHVAEKDRELVEPVLRAAAGLDQS
jgi:hypothetical protein